jgi:type IV secretion system protein VirB10
MSETEQATTPVAPPKQDPETLVLRGRPRPVVRFRRGLIVGIAAAVATGLVAVTWAALEPPSLGGATEQAADEPRSRGTPDAIAGAPASYGDVPRLGPPLPGDLGRPILEHHRNLETESQASIRGDGGSELERARTVAEAERQRTAAAEQAARAAPVIVRLSGAGETRSASLADQGSSSDEETRPDLAEARAGASTHLAAGGEHVQREGGTGVPHRDETARATLSAGTIISASMITGLNSDLPGTVLAQVTAPVRDSATGRTILIPQGSRLIGSYDSKVSYGQRRALLVWQRIVMPDGSSVPLDDLPATDAAGYAGLEDRVDFHTWRLLKSVMLSTLLGVGTELGLGSSQSDLVRAVRESTQQSGARAGEQITARNLGVEPTLQVRPGWPVRAVLHKDLVLKHWRE